MNPLSYLQNVDVVLDMVVFPTVVQTESMYVVMGQQVHHVNVIRGERGIGPKLNK